MRKNKLVYIKNITINNYKSIENLSINFNEKINIFIGPNNSGKTNILKCLEEVIRPTEKSLNELSRFNNYKDLYPSVKLTTSSGNKYVFSDEEESPEMYLPDGSKYAISKNTINHINNKFKVAIILNSFDNTEIIQEMTDYINSLSDKSKLIKFLSSLNRDMAYFSKENFSIFILKDELYINDGYGDTSLIREKSSGIQKMAILSYYLNMYSFEDSSDPDFILIDEPEVNLHTEAQRYLFSRIKEKFQNSQIFISSHSPIFINATDLDNIFLVNRNIEKGTYIDIEKKSKNKVSKLNSLLGLNLLDSLRINSASSIVLVEGQSDKLLHSYIYKRYFPNKTIEFFSIEGVDNIINYLRIFEDIFINIPLGILDYDEKGIIIAKKLKDMKYIKYHNRIILLNSKLLSEINNFKTPLIKNRIELEDLIDFNLLKDKIVSSIENSNFSSTVDLTTVKKEISSENVYNFSGICNIKSLKAIDLNKIQITLSIISHLKTLEDSDFKQKTSTFYELYNTLNSIR